MKRLMFWLIISFMMLGFVGCGSSNSSSSNETGVIYGLDKGDLYYKTPSTRGLLGENGEFKYKENELVDIYLGKDEHGVKLGSFKGDKIVTMNDITSDKLFADAIIKLFLSVDFSKTYLLSDSIYKDKTFAEIYKTEGFDENTEFAKYLLQEKIATKIATDEDVIKYKEAMENKLNPKIGILLDLAKYKDFNETILPIVKITIQTYLAQEQKPFEDVEFILKDTKADPQVALEALKELKAQNVNIVVGPSLSSVAEAILPYANDNNIVLISPSSTATELAKDDNLFRLAPNDSIEAKALATLIKNNENIKYILPIVVNDVYGNGYVNEIKTNFQDTNVTILSNVYINNDNLSETKDNAENEISDYNESEVAVVLIDYSDKVIDLLKECNNSDKLMSVRWYSNGTVINTDVESIKDIANKIQLTGLTYDNEGTKFEVYYDTLKSFLNMINVDTSYPYLFNTIDAMWLATKVYSDNRDLYYTLINEDENLSDSLKGFVYSLTNSVESSRGLLLFDTNGDVFTASFAYYKYAGKWNNIGSYKTDSLNTNVSIDENITDKTIKNINLEVLVKSDNDDEIEKMQQLTALVQNNLNALLKDEANISITFKLFDDNTPKEDILYYVMNEVQDKNISTFVTAIASRNLEILSDYGVNKNVYFIDASSTAIELKKQDTIFRLAAPDDKEVEALLWKLNKDNIKDIVIIHTDDIYGNDYAQAIKEKFEGNIVDDISFKVGTYLTDEALAELEGKKFAVVYIGLENEGIDSDYIPVVLRDKKWYASSSMESTLDFVKSDVDITFLISSLDGRNMLNPGQYTLEVEFYSNLTSKEMRLYDAIYVAALSNYRANSNGELGSTILQTLYNTNGVTGYLGVDENGDRYTNSFVFYENLDHSRWFKVDKYNN